MAILRTHLSCLQIQQNEMKQNGLGDKLLDRNQVQIKVTLCGSIGHKLKKNSFNEKRI